ncbi:MAG: acyl-CoA thioesterase [Pseudomonadales bacterium]|nr:acyl-CoA thioesterase [Pseudomonadales bacterium]
MSNTISDTTSNTMNIDLDPNPDPAGDLTTQTLTLPADTNQDGNIYGGWLASKMDMAASIACARIARGKVATVAIDGISFLAPIKVGSLVSCYTRIRAVGRSSIKVEVEAWVMHVASCGEWTKVSEGRFIFVAIDDNGRTRAIPRDKPRAKS